MKRILLVVTAGVGLVFVLAFVSIQQKEAQVLNQLGVSVQDAEDYVFLDFSHVIFSYPRTEQIVALARGDRPAVVRQLVDFAKSYTKSDEFKQRYLTFRDGKKPEAPEPPKSMDELRKEQKDQLQKSLTDIENNLKNATPEQKEQYKTLLDGLRESIKSVDDPNNPMFSKDVEKAYRQNFQNQLENFKRDSIEWAKNWTPDPNTMLTRGLEKFLEISSDVDFGAAIEKQSGGYSTFVNPDYEAKPPEWKFCFRVGKQTVEAARVAANEWVNELKSGK